MDVKTVFLHGYLVKIIYMDQPERSLELDKEGLVYRLKRLLHDLKQSPRQQYCTGSWWRIDHCLVERASCWETIEVPSQVATGCGAVTPKAYGIYVILPIGLCKPKPKPKKNVADKSGALLLIEVVRYWQSVSSSNGVPPNWCAGLTPPIITNGSSKTRVMLPKCFFPRYCQYIALVI
ncbi:hypothetical protein AKJ16_DCAP19622 [Drosera capensis]